jgi:two-component system sensor histidine kinase RegB
MSSSWIMPAPAVSPPGRIARLLPADATAGKNLLQLVQLRWMAVGGQVLTIGLVQFGFGIPLPLREMAAMLVTLVAVNLISLLRLRLRASIGPTELFLALLFDVAVLTVQLYLSGGATNPFISLYLLQVTLAAILLEVRWAWAMVAITALCCLGLTLDYRPLDLPAHLSAQLFALHLQGILVCFILDAALLVMFVTRISGNLRAHDANLAQMQRQAVEEDHIVRMGLLASGAAHELGTPLATVSVILGDWRRMPQLREIPGMAQEMEEMQAAIQRCKTIVTGILLSAGEVRGEAPEVTTVGGFFDDAVEDWRASRSAVGLVYENRFGADLPIVADPALEQVLSNVLDNAQEASPGHVRLQVRREEEMLVLEVSDDGPGFMPEMLSQLGKPYQSSKGRQGGGLGLFLVMNVVRKLGGGVAARNRPEGGATVTVSLPLAALAMDAGGRHGG